MISETLKLLINYRINQEELSARMYLAMHVWCENKGYFGTSKFFKKHYEEENKHAEKAREFMMGFNIQPETQPLDEVENNFQGLPDVLYKALEHEKLVTQQCNELAKKAVSELNFNVFELASFFVSEQNEEIKLFNDIINLLNIYGNERLALAELDEKIGEYAS